MKTIEKFRKISKFIDLTDKAICFIPSWERSWFDPAPPEIEDKEYIIQQKRLFNIARHFLFEKRIFNFLLYRRLNNEYFDNINYLKKYGRKDKQLKQMIKSSENFKNKVFKNQTERKYFDLNMELHKIVEDISIIPQENKKILDYTLKSETHKIRILCIDYNYINRSILGYFLNYSENNKTEFLNEVFSNASPDFVSFTEYKLRDFISKIFENNLTSEESDQIEFLGSNFIQNIDLPFFWKGIESEGYLCSANYENINVGKKGVKTDIRFFYSLESLLFFELKNLIKKVSRCKNCQAILVPNTKLKFCPTGTNCFKERNRKRQKMHYYSKNLTRI